jgi:hypothetical protein
MGSKGPPPSDTAGVKDSPVEMSWFPSHRNTQISEGRELP